MFNLFKKKKPELLFTEKFFAQLQKEIGPLELESIAELQLVIKHEKGSFSHHLGNAWAELQQSPNQEEAIIERFVKAARSLYLPEEELNKERIVPVLRGMENAQELMDQNGDLSDVYAWELYNDALYIFYAIDQENSIRYLKESELQSLGINKSELRELAVANLLNLIPDMECHGEDGYYMLTAGGNYEASLLLATSIWNQENFPVSGELVTAVPSRDVLLITGSLNKEGLRQMTAAIDEIYNEGSYVVSPNVFAWKQDRFDLANELLIS